MVVRNAKNSLYRFTLSVLKYFQAMISIYSFYLNSKLRHAVSMNSLLKYP